MVRNGGKIRKLFQARADKIQKNLTTRKLFSFRLPREHKTFLYTTLKNNIVRLCQLDFPTGYYAGEKSAVNSIHCKNGGPPVYSKSFLLVLIYFFSIRARKFQARYFY